MQGPPYFALFEIDQSVLRERSTYTRTDRSAESKEGTMTLGLLHSPDLGLM